jgi:hypothetical protein
MSIYRVLVAAAGKVPLRTVLIVPFVLQIVGTVGLVGYLSWRNGQQAVNDVASQLRREISDHTSDRISTYLKTPHLINSTNADAIRLYKSAVDAGKSTWSPIYVYVPSARGLGIAASYPFYNETGKFQGVLSSDLSLVAINNFLRSLKIGAHGQAFIGVKDKSVPSFRLEFSWESPCNKLNFYNKLNNSPGTLEEKRTAALEVGCDDFIRKPFREVDIFEMMS